MGQCNSSGPNFVDYLDPVGEMQCIWNKRLAYLDSTQVLYNSWTTSGINWGNVMNLDKKMAFLDLSWGNVLHLDKKWPTRTPCLDKKEHPDSTHATPIIWPKRVSSGIHVAQVYKKYSFVQEGQRWLSSAPRWIYHFGSLPRMVYGEHAGKVAYLHI